MVSRSLHVAVSLVLLAVLSGAPVVAVLCAGWCAPIQEQGHAEHSAQAAHADHAIPSAAAARDCHRTPAESGEIHALAEYDCADHGAAITRIAGWMIANRIDTVHPLATAWTGPAVVAPSAIARRSSSGSTHAPPARPVTSSLALRI